MKKLGVDIITDEASYRRGEATVDQMLDAARAKFPSVFARQLAKIGLLKP